MLPGSAQLLQAPCLVLRALVPGTGLLPIQHGIGPAPHLLSQLSSAEGERKEIMVTIMDRENTEDHQQCLAGARCLLVAPGQRVLLDDQSTPQVQLGLNQITLLVAAEINEKLAEEEKGK
jgi:hypothetical protein